MDLGLVRLNFISKAYFLACQTTGLVFLTSKTLTRNKDLPVQMMTKLNYCWHICGVCSCMNFHLVNLHLIIIKINYLLVL